MVCEWVEVEGEPWTDRLRVWLEGRGCDAWVLHDYAQDPSLYAQTRLRESLPVSEAADAESYARWMAHYRAHRVRTIHGGLIAMRRRAGGNWLRVEDLSGGFTEPFGEAVLQGFEVRDFLARHADDDDGATLALRPRIHPDCRLGQEHWRTEDGWSPQPLRLRQGSGLRRRINVDASVAGFLGGFDGARTVREAIAELAGQADAEPAQVQTEALAVIRRMLDLGFLLLPDASSVD
jgi:hypothetical protein